MFLLGTAGGQNAGNTSGVGAGWHNGTGIISPDGESLLLNGFIELEPGDLVIIHVCHSGTAARTLAQLTPTFANPNAPTSGNYTALTPAVLTASDTNVVSFASFYRFMPAGGVDTSWFVPGVAASTNSISFMQEIWRGVDQTTPFAGVTPTTATGINTGLPNPPAISTPASPKGCIVCGAFGATGDSTQNVAALTNTGATPYETEGFSQASVATTTNRSVIGRGHKKNLAVSTAFDASITGNNSGNRNSWAAVSYVLKPDASAPLAETITQDFSGIISGADWVSSHSQESNFLSHMYSAGVSYGSELVTNGSFTGNATGWTLGSGVTYGSNQLTASNATVVAQQNCGLVAGKSYRLTLDYTCTAGGLLRASTTFRDDATGPPVNGTRFLGAAYLTTDGAARTLTIDFVAEQQWISLEAQGATFTGTIDNVSIKEVTGLSNKLKVRPADGFTAHRRLQTRKPFKLRGSSFYVRVSDMAVATKGVLHIMFTNYAQLNSGSGGNRDAYGVTSDGNNWNVQHDINGNLFSGTANYAYDSTNHKWIRIGHDDTTDQVYVQTAPDNGNVPGTWTDLHRAARPTWLNVDGGLIAIGGGSWGYTNTLEIGFQALNTSVPSGIALIVGAANSNTAASNVTLGGIDMLASMASSSSSTTTIPVLSVKYALAVAGASSLSVESSPTVGVGAISLVPAAAASLSVTSSPTLSPKTSLILAAASSLSVTDSPSLTPRWALTLAGAASLSVTDSPTLTPRTGLVLASAASLSTTGSPVLTPKTSIVVQAASSTSVTDAVSLTPRWALALDAASSASVTSSPILALNGSLGISPPVSLSVTTSPVLLPKTALFLASASSLSTVDNVLVTNKAQIQAQAASSASVTTSPTLALKTALALQAATSLSTAELLTLLAKTQLTPAQAASLSTTTSPVLTPRTALAPAAASSASIADAITLVTKYGLTIQQSASLTASDNVSLSPKTLLAIQNLISAALVDDVYIAQIVIDTPDARQLEVGDSAARLVEAPGTLAADRKVEVPGTGVRTL